MPDPFIKTTSRKHKGVRQQDVVALRQHLQAQLAPLRMLQDETAIVLRSSLVIERALHSVLVSYFAYANTASTLDSENGFRLSQSIELLRLTNLLREDQVSALHVLRRIRNKFAHNETTLRAVLKIFESSMFLRFKHSNSRGYQATPP